MPSTLAPTLLAYSKLPYQISTDILFLAAATDREDEDAILIAEPATFQPLHEGLFPAIVIDPRRQLRSIVAGRIGFDAGDLASVVDGTTGVTGALISATRCDKLARNVILFRFSQFQSSLSYFELWNRIYFDFLSTIDYASKQMSNCMLKILGRCLTEFGILSVMSGDH